MTHGAGTGAKGLGPPSTTEGPEEVFGEGWQGVCNLALHDAVGLPPTHHPSDLPLLAPGMRGIWWDSGSVKGWSSPSGNGSVSGKKQRSLLAALEEKKRKAWGAGWWCRGLAAAPQSHALPVDDFSCIFHACFQAGNGLWKQMMQREYLREGGTQLLAKRGNTKGILGGCKLGNYLSSTRATFILEL